MSKRRRLLLQGRLCGWMVYDGFIEKNKKHFSLSIFLLGHPSLKISTSNIFIDKMQSYNTFMVPWMGLRPRNCNSRSTHYTSHFHGASAAGF